MNDFHVTEAEAKGDAAGGPNHPDGIPTDTAQETRERPPHQVPALQNEKPASSPSVPPSASLETSKSPRSRFPDDTKGRPLSLATFMGGRAAGPRLNKHHPPQDAYTPTTSQQRNFDRLPHPMSGGGGVPLPGMARPSITSEPTRASEAPAQITASSIRHQGATRAGTVHRATSTPLLTSPGSAANEPVQSLSPEVYHSTSAASVSQVTPGRRGGSRRTVDGWGTGQTRSPANGSSSRMTTPFLSRPNIPEPRPFASAPQISASHAPSKAFLRPQAQKEVTPSISRLQGRGFVRSMVKVSADLESQPALIKETERAQMAGEKRFSVLDRWQPGASPKTAIPSASPIPPDLRKSAINDPLSTLSETTRRTQATTKDCEMVDMDDTPQPLKRRSHSSSISPEVKDWNSHRLMKADSPLTGRIKSPKGGPPRLDGRNTAAEVVSMPIITENTSPVGLGSATTLHVYKPKTVQATKVDELGYHTGKNTPMALPAPSRNPLSHVRSFR